MGGVWTRLKLACAAFFTILFNGRLPAALQIPRPAEPAAAAAAPPVSEQPDGAIQMLALLQREGRFVDFVLEDLTAYSDAQIGAAVRDVHAGCRGVFTRYVTLEPILSGTEGETDTVAAGRSIPPPFAWSATWPGNRRSAARCSTAAGAPSGSSCRRSPLAPAARIVAPAEVEVA